MTTLHQPFFESLGSLGQAYKEPLPVTLSPELIGLLSEQLYRSPSKAIEELVVNGFDAEADEARVFVPEPGTETPFIVVYDDGSGMTYEGLADLWKVGRRKNRDDSVFERKQRRQIGKFGIGKLATYAVANRVTYVTKAEDQHLAVTIDYKDFTANPNANTTDVRLEVRKVDSLDELWNEGAFSESAQLISVDRDHLAARSSWTIVILEEHKDKVQSMGLGRLRRVLRTAMPLSPRFKLFLNNEEIVSSKEDYETLVEFDISELPKIRLDGLKSKTGEEWSAKDKNLLAKSFPLGISGSVFVTKQTLVGKSSDLLRSEGFFVYVRERLVNEEDARFGLHELSHATLNRFRADVRADDLDRIVTANRESMEDVKLYRDAQAVLNELFNEARQRYETRLEDDRKGEKKKQEERRSWVPERLVEHPTADALTMYSHDRHGAEADDSWMYLNVDPGTDIESLTKSLYSRVGRENPYKYQYVARGRAERLVEFDPGQATFSINQDHELVVAYGSDASAERLMHDFVTSEALLEVYLREAGVEPYLIGEVLERRDLLIRGLADAHMFSLEALSQYVINSVSSSTDLEVAVVAGARALGFVAKHIGGNGEPDGIARFTDFPGGEQKITLEAKSSEGTPSAKDIDFAAIANHMTRHDATGCLLVAPSYPGGTDGNVALSATDNRISCWTARQFSDVINSAESRQISARQILEIIRSSFAPDDVSRALEELLSDPTWKRRDLYFAVVEVLRNLEGILVNSPRNVTMISTQIAQLDGFEGIEVDAVRRAVSHLAGASQGSILLRDNDDVVLNVDCDELERRIQSLTGHSGTPRRKGAFGEVTR